MSSEMRAHTTAELLALYDANGGDWCKIARAVEERFLARTEAGADGKPGSVAKRKRIELEDRGYVVNGVCFKHPESGERGMLCNGGSVHWLAHPQDASGDATMLDWLDLQAADGVHVEVCCTGNFDARTIARKATVYLGRPQSEHEAASVREAIRNAMQAKEAK